MLSERASWLRERMDDPSCDPELLRNTYRNFALVNPLVTGWRRLFARQVAPRLGTASTLLDVGCGGGDLARRLRAWSERAGRPLEVTAIDPDARAVEFARSRPPLAGVNYRQASAEELVAAGERFDLVVSNHLLHHLGDGELAPFLRATAALASRAVIHNDLSRHPLALAAFSLTRPLFPRSFTTEDGLLSIRRAFTAAELRAFAPSGWRVATLVPFRNVLVLEK